MKCLFIDFAMLSHRTKVTGIPRVTYQYFRYFMDISLQRGGDWLIIPVYVEREGILRNALHNLPQHLIDQYVAYIDRLCKLQPDRGLHAYQSSLAGQISPKSVVTPNKSRSNEKVTIKRRLARAKRRLLSMLAGKDLVLNSRVKSHPRSNEESSSSIENTLPLVDNELFHTENKDIFHKIADENILFMPAYWHDVAPMRYFTLQQLGMLIIPMLHDLLPVIISDKYNQTWTRHFHFNVYTTCLLADAVVAISDATRSDLGLLMDSHSLPSPKVFVHHHGFDFQSNQDTYVRFPADVDYFIMVGSIEPKKNHLLVIEQFLEVSKKYPQARLKIIGYPGWMHEEITSRIALAKEQGHPVDHYQNVEDYELVMAYKNAKATIMASSHEGFGLPVIESLSLGCPVILSDIPIFREIAGVHGHYFSLSDPSTLATIMEQMLEQSVSKPVDGFKWPDWSSQADVLFNWLVSQQRRSRAVYNSLQKCDSTQQ